MKKKSPKVFTKHNFYIYEIIKREKGWNLKNEQENNLNHPDSTSKHESIE